MYVLVDKNTIHRFVEFNKDNYFNPDAGIVIDTGLIENDGNGNGHSPQEVEVKFTGL